MEAESASIARRPALPMRCLTRQEDRDNGALSTLSLRATNMQGTLMARHNLLADPQPETCAADALSGEEGIEGFALY